MERVSILFLYTKGQQVRFGGWAEVFIVQRRRYTEREVMAPLVEYLLQPPAGGHLDEFWALEADMTPVEKA